MNPSFNLCLILLTYKGKVLLLQQENLTNTGMNNAWHVILKLLPKDASAEDAIIQEVQKEMLVTLDSVTLLSSTVHNDTRYHVFHARLSDKHVNEIARSEGRILQFFELRELNKLQLQPSTKSFFSQNQTLVEHLAVC